MNNNSKTTTILQARTPRVSSRGEKKAKRKPTTFPDLLALEFLAHHKIPIRYYRGDFFCYKGTHYEPVEDDYITSSLSLWLQDSCDADGKKLPITNNLLANIRTNIKAKCYIDGNQNAPLYCGNGKDFPAKFLPFSNGILDLSHYLETGNPRLLEHTPDLFTLSCGSYPFDELAQCPLWHWFLGDIFNRDAQTIEAVHRWMGYHWLGEYFLHKAAMFYGDTRSAKGVLMDSMEGLLGPENCASPTTSNLGERFGKAQLLGKKAVLIHETHLGHSSHRSEIVEFVKLLTSNNPTTIERKGKDVVTSRLDAKLTFAVNELPQLPDLSNALTGRILFFHFPNSYLGREDPTLRTQLAQEYPGIANWVLEGARKLWREKKIDEPAASAQLREDFDSLTSPIKVFLKDCCTLRADAEIPCVKLYRAYTMWCSRCNHTPFADNKFGVFLKGMRKVERKQLSKPYDNVQRPTYYCGIGLTPEAEQHFFRS